MDKGEYEMFLTFEYNIKDVVEGNPNSKPTPHDKGVEFSVSRAKLIHAKNVTTSKKIF